MNKALEKQIDEFRIKADQFSKGEISTAEYKAFSGKFGSYAQRGGKDCMLRLRIPGGQLSKEKLKSIIDICNKYDIKRIHCTTCQTIQLHDLTFDTVADIMTDAIKSGFYCIGGGGDFPRNVMVSPLTGVEKNEFFNVYPYAEKAHQYLLKQIDTVKMPRKLKVGFSNSPENTVHATFRDLGFVARSDGKFDVYCAGGMGPNPRIGIKVAHGADGTQVLYYIQAMVSLFCKYGNYQVRSKARTRYMQAALGDRLADEFNAELQQALRKGGLDIEVRLSEIKKQGTELKINSKRIIEQKQKGLYTVKFHPIGGNVNPEILEKIYNAILDMPKVSLRLSPDETIYIINCDGNEVEKVLEVTADSAKKDIEESVSCVGTSVCQLGLRDSQELLRTILDTVKPYNFPVDALPVMHISGCMSSCGTHQIGRIGFHGKVKMVDKKPVSGFTININGNDRLGYEKFGDELGVVATDDIPKLIVEIGQAVTQAKMGFDEFACNNADELIKIIEKYI